jgi:hypothetical protein
MANTNNTEGSTTDWIADRMFGEWDRDPVTKKPKK